VIGPLDAIVDVIKRSERIKQKVVIVRHLGHCESAQSGLTIGFSPVGASADSSYSTRCQTVRAVAHSPPGPG